MNNAQAARHPRSDRVRGLSEAALAAWYLLVQGIVLIVIAAAVSVTGAARAANDKALALVVLLGFGLPGIAGGLAVLRASRRWSWAAYLSAPLCTCLYSRWGRSWRISSWQDYPATWQRLSVPKMSPKPDDPWKALDWGSLPTVRRGDR